MSLSIKRKQTQKQLLTKSSAAKKFHQDQTVLAATLSSPALVNDLVPELKLVSEPIKELKSAKRRVRKATKRHLASIIKSIEMAGQVLPILIDRERRIVDGHVVVEALKSLGETYVTVVCLDHLNENQIKFLQVALNKLSEGSEWDLEELKPMFEELELVGFDLTATGFTLPEIDIITQPKPEENQSEADELIEPPAKPVTRPGDLWELNGHRLLCGDALDARSYAAVLGMRKADASFTDCPWNLAGKQISSKHGDFKMAAGEMSEEAFQEFVDSFTALIAEFLEEGGVLYSCIDWRSHDKVVTAGKRAGLRHINTIVWSKGSGGMGGLYRSAHELIPTFVKGKSPKANNVQLGRHGRDRTNVWSYPGATTPGSSAAKANKHHPTPKPIEMVEDAILDVTSRGELVLDPFMGSGTTLLAAERARRTTAGIEIDPAYVDVCIRRWEELTGADAIHVQSGSTFKQLAERPADEEFEGERGND